MCSLLSLYLTWWEEMIHLPINSDSELSFPYMQYKTKKVGWQELGVLMFLIWCTTIVDISLISDGHHQISDPECHLCLLKLLWLQKPKDTYKHTQIWYLCSQCCQAQPPTKGELPIRGPTGSMLLALHYMPD